MKIYTVHHEGGYANDLDFNNTYAFASLKEAKAKVKEIREEYCGHPNYLVENNANSGITLYKVTLKPLSKKKMAIACMTDGGWSAHQSCEKLESYDIGCNERCGTCDHCKGKGERERGVYGL